MSRIDESILIATFPYALSGDDSQQALAQATAKEAFQLINDLELLKIYSRIDYLDEELLDILAYDFKIDWWDRTGSIEEKRQLLKDHWKVHKMLGTPEALKLAFSTIFDNSEVKSWNEYGGNPYHFKLFVDTGEQIPNYEKLLMLIERLKYYSNVRSKLDGASFTSVKNARKVYYGFGLQSRSQLTLSIPEVEPTSLTWLVDENNNDLVDENGMLLFE